MNQILFAVVLCTLLTLSAFGAAPAERDPYRIGDMVYVVIRGLGDSRHTAGLPVGSDGNVRLPYVMKTPDPVKAVGVLPQHLGRQIEVAYLAKGYTNVCVTVIQEHEIHKFVSDTSEGEICQLPVGTVPGSFVLSYTGRVTWSEEPLFPVDVSLKQGKRTVATLRVRDGNEFELRAEVRPGRYLISSEIPSNAPPVTYWGAFGPMIRVDSNGTATVQSHDIFHEKVMKLLWPAACEVVSTNRPTLKWEAIPGAAYYTVGWFEEPATHGEVIRTKQNLETRIPEYTFEEAVVPGRRYEWFVHAHKASGESFAYYSSGYFRTADDAGKH